MSILVFDIETVPDYTLWSPAQADNTPPPEPEIDPKTGKPKKPRKAAKPRVKKSDTFAPHHAQVPVAIGYVFLTDEFQVVDRGIGCVGMSSMATERDLLVAWSMFMDQQRPSVVTFGGRSFDMPVLTLRSFRWGVGQRWYGKAYRHRYDEQNHLDLCDVLTEFGAVPKTGFGLDTLCTIIGLPTKGEMDGSKVAELYAAGEKRKIEAYATCDAAKTAFALMRYELMRGKIDLAQYQTAANRLLGMCDELGMYPVTKGVDRSRLLFEG